MYLMHHLWRIAPMLLCAVLFHNCQSRSHSVQEEILPEAPPALEVPNPIRPIPTLAFGAKAWRDYFDVDVGREPTLPVDIDAILNAECPFLLDGEERKQSVRDNHLLVLIPATVDEKQFTLDGLGKLIAEKYPYNEQGYRYYAPAVRKMFGNVPLPGESYWLLMTRGVLLGSRDRSYTHQKTMVSRYRNHGYRLPYALGVAACILTHYARSGTHSEWLLGDTPLTYTSCATTQLVRNGHPLSVGAFGAEGFDVSYRFFGRCDLDGVSCCRKL